MLAFAEMLVPAAKEAGIKVPKNPDKYNPSRFPHWHVFCNWQLGRSMPDWQAHWDNAKTIAALEVWRLKTMRFGDLFEAGCR